MQYGTRRGHTTELQQRSVADQLLIVEARFSLP